MSNITEYQEEYCGRGGGSGGGGGGTVMKSSKDQPTTFPECTKSFEEQPVGGRVQERARAEAQARAQTATGLPAYDTGLVSTVYSEADRGCHRVGYSWRDPRWSDATRIDSSTLYHPADRDPPNRPNFYVYKSTLVDAMDTPCKPLAVPDVHKLRYMHTDYMTYDDWY